MLHAPHIIKNPRGCLDPSKPNTINRRANSSRLNSQALATCTPPALQALLHHWLSGVQLRTQTQRHLRHTFGTQLHINAQQLCTPVVLTRLAASHQCRPARHKPKALTA